MHKKKRITATPRRPLLDKRPDLPGRSETFGKTGRVSDVDAQVGIPSAIRSSAAPDVAKRHCRGKCLSPASLAGHRQPLRPHRNTRRLPVRTVLRSPTPRDRRRQSARCIPSIFFHCHPIVSLSPLEPGRVTGSAFEGGPVSDPQGRGCLNHASGGQTQRRQGPRPQSADPSSHRTSLPYERLVPSDRASGGKLRTSVRRPVSFLNHVGDNDHHQNEYQKDREYRVDRRGKAKPHLIQHPDRKCWRTARQKQSDHDVIG
jgi:hypothetical protein